MEQEQKFKVLETEDEQTETHPGDRSSLPEEEGPGPAANLEVQNDEDPSAMQWVRPQSPWLQTIHEGKRKRFHQEASGMDIHIEEDSNPAELEAVTRHFKGSPSKRFSLREA